MAALATDHRGFMAVRFRQNVRSHGIRRTVVAVDAIFGVGSELYGSDTDGGHKRRQRDGFDKIHALLFIRVNRNWQLERSVEKRLPAESGSKTIS